MKRIYVLLGCLSLGLILQAQPNKVNFFMDVCRFQDFRLDKPLAEIYFSVDGTSIRHQQQEDGKYHAQVNLLWVLKRLQGEDTTNIAGDNILLDWPQGAFPKDTTEAQIKRSLLHIQKLDLDPGKYLLEAIAEDKNSPLKNRSLALYEFEMERLKADEFGFSDIKWISPEKARITANSKVRTRNDLLPMVANDAFINQDTMYFYQEVYNASRITNGKFIIVQSTLLQGDDILWQYQKANRHILRPGSQTLYLTYFVIDKLKSNSYYLQIDIKDERNRVLRTYKKKFYVYNSRLEAEFEETQLSNREADIFNEFQEQDLDYFMKTLRYIATDQEKNFIKVLNSYEQKKNYLYSFFEKRKRYPEQKVLALWKGHLMALNYVNQHFKSSFGEGWETDRGRVFLTYGIPSDIERYPAESSLLPYEIWRYDRLGVQTNVIFVFYDHDLASNEYPLLHASKYGEINNPRWKTQLMAQNKGQVPSVIDYERQNSRFNRLNDKLDPNN